MREWIDRKIRSLMPWLILAALVFIAYYVYEGEQTRP
jgi:hypothetical protein